MKAIILAAGIGSRLKPLTDSIPKCMIEVNGIKIIQQQIENLIVNKVRDIIVVAGYKKELLIQYIQDKYPKVQVIENTEYARTNNMYSLYLCRYLIHNESILLMNADVFFSRVIIRDLLIPQCDNLIACDKGNYMEESMKITVANNQIIEISKKISSENSWGTSIDVYKFSESAVTSLFNIICEYIEVKKELNLWTEVAINELLKSAVFQPLGIKGNWVEIDNHDDLKIAEELFT